MLVRANSVLPDANIWASATLHSWFGLIAANPNRSWDFFWTEDILLEAGYARRRRYPYAGSKQIEDIRDRIVSVLPDSQIRNFPIDRSVEYPDPLDAHVHSAAVHAHIAEVVTNNIRDFHDLSCGIDALPYEVFAADEWLIRAASSNPHLIDDVLALQLQYHRRLGKSLDFHIALERAGCPEFGAYIGRRLDV